MSRRIDPGMSVPELMNILRNSFRESHYEQVQNIWMDREKEKESAKKEARLLQEKCSQLENERDELKRQNAEAAAKSLDKELNVTISSFETKVGEMENEIEVLKRENDELRREKIESVEKAESCKMKLEARIMKVEGALANLLNVKVEDLAPLANSLDKTDAEGGNVDNNSGDSCTKDDGANTAQTSPGSQSGGSPPRVEPQDPENVNGAQAGDLIVILDTDDESNCDDKIDSDTSLTKREKRSRSYISDEEDNNIPMVGKENHDSESTHDRNGVLYTDSEDDLSCSDSFMNHLAATIRSQKTGRA